MSGQSKPTWAARELSLYASIRDGIAVETPASTDSVCFFCFPCLGCPLLFFFNFQRLPVAQDFGGSIGFHIAENMGMAVDQLRGQAIQNVIDGEGAVILRHLGVEKNLKQQVAEFAGKFVPVAIVDGFQDFVGFFQACRA